VAHRLVRLPLLAFAAAFALSCAPAYAHGHDFEGTLGIQHTDGIEGHDSTWSYSLDEGDRTVPVLPTRLGAAGSGDLVKVAGDEENGRITGSVQSLKAGVQALGGRKVAVILFNFTGDTREPWTPAQVRQRLFTAADSTSAFFREESHDQLWLTGKLDPDGDVFGWYTIPDDSAGCSTSYDDWSSDAHDAAVANGVDLSGYDSIMYVFPSVGGCGFAGAAMVGGDTSWINGDISVRVTAHELGHNLILHHANSYTCTSGGVPVAIGGSCTSNEYGDPFDVMGGYGSRHSSGWHLQKLGLLTPAQVQTVTESGTYTLHSAMSQPADAVTLRIPRRRDAFGNPLDWYYLEVRQQGGVFENFNDLTTHGVSIRLNDNPNVISQSRLIDTTPGSPSGMTDSPLAVGSTFTDGQISVTTTAALNGVATVEISLSGPPADGQPPTAPGKPHASLFQGGVNVSWDASSDNVAVARYLVFRDGQQLGSVTAPFFNDVTAAAGTHVYTVFAEDAAANRSPSSAPVELTVPAAGGHGHSGFDDGEDADTEAPELWLRPRRAGRNMRFAVIARDKSGVARVELWLDGRRRSVARRPKLTYRWNTRAARAGSHRVVARAIDVKGNRASVSMRLRSRR
jgi:hypothetical protein